MVAVFSEKNVGSGFSPQGGATPLCPHFFPMDLVKSSVLLSLLSIF